MTTPWRLQVLTSKLFPSQKRKAAKTLERSFQNEGNGLAIQ